MMTSNSFFLRLIKKSLIVGTICGFNVLGLAQINSVWSGGNGVWTSAVNWSTNPNYPDNAQPAAGDIYNATIGVGQVTQNVTTGANGLPGVTLKGLTLTFLPAGFGTCRATPPLPKARAIVLA